MFCSKLLLLSTLAAATSALGNKHHNIVWKSSCDAGIVPAAALPIQCGSLPVPVDYTNANKSTGDCETFDLQLYRIPVANGTKSKHSVLVNFGGPGNNGTAMLAANATSLRLLLGEDHDIVLVVPRGNTGSTFDFSCSENAYQGAQQAAWTTKNGNASDLATGELWATTGLYANACKVSPHTTDGNDIGTAFTARDFMQVAEALDEDGLIYYQGYSYGTVLGMTIAALFPHKIGRMVLDGNVNAQDYYHGSYTNYYSDADEVFSLFCSTCIATPQLCLLAKNQSSAATLESKLLSFFEHLKDHPVPVAFSDGQGGLVDYSFIVSTVYNFLYEPTLWPTLSALLASLIAGDTSFITESLLLSTTGPDQISGIRCGDNRFRTSDPAYLDSIIDTTEAKSSIFGSISVSLYYTCAQWPFEAKGNFSWPSNNNASIHTRSPVLLIGNSHDPATPLANAKFNSAALERSVVLQQNGVGHTAFLTQGSLCTARALRAYWMNGTLPREGTICDIQTAVFSLDNGWETVLKQLAQQENGQAFG